MCVKCYFLQREKNILFILLGMTHGINLFKFGGGGEEEEKQKPVIF